MIHIRLFNYEIQLERFTRWEKFKYRTRYYKDDLWEFILDFAYWRLYIHKQGTLDVEQLATIGYNPNNGRKESTMPDTFRYTSVSVSKRAHEDLTKVKDQISYEVGFDISIAKVIEKIAAQEAEKYAGK